MKKNTMNEVNLVVYGDLDVLHSVELGNSKLFVKINDEYIELDVQLIQITGTDDF